MEYMALPLIATVIGVLLLGYPVAFSIAGVSLLFALPGAALGVFSVQQLHALPELIYTNVLTNTRLIALPLFVCMGLSFKHTGIAEDLRDALAGLRRHGALSIVLAGTLQAVGAGMTAGQTSATEQLPQGKPQVHSAHTTWAMCASTSLAQSIPPSVLLLLLGDALAGAWLLAQPELHPTAVPLLGDIFFGALTPGLLLALLYLACASLAPRFWPDHRQPAQATEIRPAHSQQVELVYRKTGVDTLHPAGNQQARRLLAALATPLLLWTLVLGTVGYGSPALAACAGIACTLLLGLIRRRVDRTTLAVLLYETALITSSILAVVLGAWVFLLVFRGYGGDSLLAQLLHTMPGGQTGSTLLVLALMFALGLLLGFIEIVYLLVPIAAPLLLIMGVHPVWLGVAMALVLQTAFVLSPFGCRRCLGLEGANYKTLTPCIAIQLLVLLALYCYPQLALWLPNLVFGE